MAEAAVQKREDIRKANKMMFLWVAGASIIIGASLVVAGFLLQKAIFKQDILSVKGQTLQTLQQNNRVADELKANVRALNVNERLASVMIDDAESPVMAVLDALPSTANSAAFGASLQKKILEGDQVSIETLRVDPVAGAEAQSTGETAPAPAEGAEVATESQNVISFSFTIQAPNGDALKETLKRVERSIRPISPLQVIVEGQGGTTTMQVSGVTYYEPARTVDLTTKSVTPKKGFGL